MDSTSLEAALHYNSLGISTIPLARGSKEPPRGFRWKQFQRRRPTVDELKGWHDGTEFGVAIVCGEVSGGLLVRDYDVMGSFDRWRELYSDLSERLPTAATARGAHVYARSRSTDHVDLSDGELRGEGHYVVAPPSIHPSGQPYRWLRPLTDEIPFLADPAAFLLSSSTTAQQTQADTANTCMCVTNLDAAIQATLPAAHGQRNGCLFQLARHLKAMIPDARRPELREVIKNWHKLALANIKTKSIDATWQDFVSAWQRIKRPAGQPRWAEVLAIAETIPLPACGSIYDSEPYHRLVMCLALHQAHGGGHFPLACRMAANHCGVCEKTGANMLKTLVFDKLLAVHGKHPPGKRLAHEYRFTGIGGGR